MWNSDHLQILPSWCEEHARHSAWAACAWPRRSTWDRRFPHRSQRRRSHGSPGTSHGHGHRSRRRRRRRRASRRRRRCSGGARPRARSSSPRSLPCRTAPPSRRSSPAARTPRRSCASPPPPPPPAAAAAARRERRRRPARSGPRGPSTAARMGSSSCAAAAAASAAEACGCRRRRGGGGCSWGSCGAPPATGSTRIPPAWRRSARPASSPRHPPSSPSSPPSHIRFFTRTSKIFLLLKRKFSARDQEHKSDKGRILLRTPTALHGREIGRTKKVWKDQQKSGVFASRKLKEQKRSLLLIGKNNTTAKWQLEIIQITDNTTQEARFHLEKPPPPQQHKEEEELQEAILVS